MDIIGDYCSTVLDLVQIPTKFSFDKFFYESCKELIESFESKTEVFFGARCCGLALSQRR